MKIAPAPATSRLSPPEALSVAGARAATSLAKRALDIVLAASGIILLSPLFLVLAAAIRLADGSPVLFRQRRAGLNGRPFVIVKFRTMHRDAQALQPSLRGHNAVAGGASFKMRDDPRITPLGRFLRRTSLDELPQLWNVLRGEMSLVGPRPHPLDDVNGYKPWHYQRLTVRPGITGLWQIEARNAPEFDQWVEKDLEYIDRWSVRLDLEILLRTPLALVRSPGR